MTPSGVLLRQPLRCDCSRITPGHCISPSPTFAGREGCSRTANPTPCSIRCRRGTTAPPPNSQLTCVPGDIAFLCMCFHVFLHSPHLLINTSQFFISLSNRFYNSLFLVTCPHNRFPCSITLCSLSRRLIVCLKCHQKQSQRSSTQTNTATQWSRRYCQMHPAQGRDQHVHTSTPNGGGFFFYKEREPDFLHVRFQHLKSDFIPNIFVCSVSLHMTVYFPISMTIPRQCSFLSKNDPFF